MGLISLLLKNPFAFLILTVPLLYSVILHEIAHGFAAGLFGDSTAKDYGRLTLNPLSHLDPMGTLALFLIGFGWAKPVPVDYSRIKNKRVGIIVVSLAGCATNILIATIALFIVKAGILSNSSFLSVIVYIVAKINIILASLNLIPIPPLDGSKALMAILPYEARVKYARLEPYGFPILLILLFTGMLSPLINFMQNLILTLISFVLPF